jgi:hypothetical protein
MAGRRSSKASVFPDAIEYASDGSLAVADAPAEWKTILPDTGTDRGL